LRRRRRGMKTEKGGDKARGKATKEKPDRMRENDRGKNSAAGSLYS
jgi:hypothetical protein